MPDTFNGPSGGPTSPKTTVVSRSLDDLRPWAQNTRTHSKPQIRQIADSIKAFGYRTLIITDEADRVLAGHGRLEALRSLGWTSADVMRVEGLSETQKRGFAIADNKTAEMAGWDDANLCLEFEYLLEFADDFDVTATGFAMPEIDLIIGGEDEHSENPGEELPSVDETAVPISRRGDVWQLGRHRLMCGDATMETDFRALMDDTKAEMVFVDPPFNLEVNGHISGKGRTRHREFVMASGEMSTEAFTDFLTAAMAQLASNSADGSVHFVCMDWRHLRELLAAADGVYSKLLNLCVWAKTNGGMGSLYRSQHELVFVFKNGSGRHINHVELGRHGRNRTNVWAYPGANAFGAARAHDLALHPTVKPVEMVADAMLDCSNRGGVVLDSFVGSGTTIIAAEKVGRRAFAMELDPLYVDTAIRRWRAYTGDRAVHAVTGTAFDDLEAEGADDVDAREVNHG